MKKFDKLQERMAILSERRRISFVKGPLDYINEIAAGIWTSAGENGPNAKTIASEAVTTFDCILEKLEQED